MNVLQQEQTSIEQSFKAFVAEPSLSCLQRVVQMMFAKAANESFQAFEDMNRDIYSALMCVTKLDAERSELVDEIINSINQHLEDNKPSPSLLFNLLRLTEKVCEISSIDEMQALYELVIDCDFWSYPYVFDESDEMYVETILHLYSE